MPVININEYENISFTAFDATENVVLIPMLYARNEPEFTINGVRSDDPTKLDVTYNVLNVPSKKYTSYKEFSSDMSGHVVTIDDDDLDKSYIMAYELLLQGLSVVIKPILFDNAYYAEWSQNSEGIINIDNNGSVPLEDAYRILEESILGPANVENRFDPETRGPALDEFKDRNLYNLKFLTTGGYANCGDVISYSEDVPPTERLTLTSYKVLENLAESRGDAIALVEYRPIFNSQEELLRELDKANPSFYAAGFFPWCVCQVTAGGRGDNVEMPASFCYLSAYANSVQYSANWFAAAGVTRGRVPSLITPLYDVGESLMHIVQNDSEAESSTLSYVTVNPVYNAGTYGYRIWGNRILNRNSEDIYRNFLNVRVLLCDIKKQIYHAAMRLTFEPNDDIVWVNFKTLVNSTLERMKSGRGISWYKWTREYPDNKAQIKATLTIKPIEAVESFDIAVVLTDEEAVVEEYNGFMNTNISGA